MKKTNDYKPSKGLQVITQNKKAVTGLVICAYIIALVILFFVCKKNLQDTNHATQILNGVFVVGGLVVSVLQYTASNVENSILRDQEKKN